MFDEIATEWWIAASADSGGFVTVHFGPKAWPEISSFSTVASDPPMWFCFEGTCVLFIIDRNWSESKLNRANAHYASAKACLPWLFPFEQGPAVAKPENYNNMFQLDWASE